MMTLPGSSGSFWKRWTPLFGVGMLGIASLAPQTLTLLRGTGQVPEAALPLVVVASTLQSGLLLGGLVAVGTALAPRLGLYSHLAKRFADGTPLWPAIRRELPTSMIGGALSLALVTGADLAFRPLMGDALEKLNTAVPHRSLYVSLLGLLYGGITEELMMRWGIMTFFARIGWRLVQRGSGRPRPAIMWAAIVLAALLFAAGHLPFTATIVALTPTIIVRALLLNGIAGVIFGWLYWQHSLEAAMIAHASFHAALTILTVSTV